MPESTTRWSRQMTAFLDARRGGSSEHDAAVAACGAPGPTAARFARRMKTNPAMQAALRQDAADLAAATGWTLRNTVDHLERVRDLAIAAQQFTAAARYDEFLAKIRGHMPDKPSPFTKGATGAAAQASVTMIDLSKLDDAALSALAEKVAHVRAA